MAQNVVVKDVKHHRMGGRIEMTVYTETINGGNTTHGQPWTYSVDATTLQKGWGGKIENWLAYVKNKHLSLQTMTDEAVTAAMAMKGKTL